MDKELFERIKNVREESKYLYDLGVLNCDAGLEGLNGIHVDTDFVRKHLGDHLNFGKTKISKYPYFAYKAVDNTTFFTLLDEQEYIGLKNAPSAATE